MDIYVDDVLEFQQDAADKINAGFVVINRPVPGETPSMQKLPSKLPSPGKKEGSGNKKTAPKGRLTGGLSARSAGRYKDPQPHHQRFLTIEGSFRVEKTDPGAAKRLTRNVDGQAPEGAKTEQ